MSLELVDICHRYGADAPVLMNVNVVLHHGALVGVVGPSGSGKSTLLAIAGLLTNPWHGDVIYEGQPIEKRSRINRSQIGWIFQSSNLLPRRSAVENTMMGPLSCGQMIDQAQIDSGNALTQVEIAHLAQVPVRFLSGGEAQRVGIARALASQSAYLFADEPTGQLDAVTTAVVVKALGMRRHQGLVTLVATHDPIVARSCDYVYTLTNGRLASGV